MNKLVVVLALACNFVAIPLRSTMFDTVKEYAFKALNKVDGSRGIEAENELLLNELKNNFCMNETVSLRTMGWFAKTQATNRYVWGCCPGVVDRVYINQEQFNTLPLPAKRFVLAHELMRIKHKHFVQIVGVALFLKSATGIVKNCCIPKKYKDNLLDLFWKCQIKKLAHEFNGITPTLNPSETRLKSLVESAPASPLKQDLKRALLANSVERTPYSVTVSAVIQAFIGGTIDHILHLPIAFYVRALELEADKAAIEALSTTKGAHRYLRNLQNEKSRTVVATSWRTVLTKPLLLLHNAVSYPLNLVPALEDTVSSKNSADQRRTAIRAVSKAKAALNK